MLRVAAVVLVLALVSVPVVSFANPDGPVGSLTLQPSFNFGPKAWTVTDVVDASGLHPTISGERQTWRMALQATLAVSNHATLGFEFSRSQDIRELSELASGPGQRDQGVSSIKLFNNATIFARFHFQTGLFKR